MTFCSSSDIESNAKITNQWMISFVIRNMIYKNSEREEQILSICIIVNRLGILSQNLPWKIMGRKPTLSESADEGSDSENNPETHKKMQ